MAVKTFTQAEQLTAADTNTYLANSGLVYVAAQTFTNAATWQFDNCFSSNYSAYRLTIVVTSSVSTNTQLSMRYGNGSTFSDTNIYGNAHFYITTTSATGAFFTSTGTGFHFLGQVGGDKMPSSISVDLHSPFETERTTYTSQSYSSYNSAGLQTQVATYGGGFHDAATSYASLRIFNGALANMSGRVNIYGYRKP